MIWSRYRRYESRAADRLIFPANPGGGRSPSHDHDGLEARLGNDHATSRPSLLPNNVRGFTRLWAGYLEGSYGSFARPADSLPLFFTPNRFESKIKIHHFSGFYILDDCLRRWFRVSMGERQDGRKADESNFLFLQHYHSTRIEVESFRKRI